jgi:membrane fusion protein (multidrug efflux system)
MHSTFIHFSIIIGIAVLGASLASAQPGAARLVSTDSVISTELSQSVELVGTINARKRSRLSPRLSGLIETMEVDFGSRVKQGDVLLRLDDTLARLALERITAQIEGAQAQLRDAQRRFDETESLADSGGISKSERDSRRAVLLVSEARVSELEAVFNEQEERINRHQLHAPFSGVIGTRYVQVGEWVQTQDAVLELVETDALFFDVQAPQNLFETLKVGTPASVKMDASKDDLVEGKIAVVVPLKDPASRTFLIRIAVAAPINTMIPGASGRAVFQIGDPEPEIAISRDALVRQPDGSYLVWVVPSGGDPIQAVARRVEVGIRSEDMVEVLSGLEVGEQVIIRGNESLQPGDMVKVVTSDS